VGTWKWKKKRIFTAKSIKRIFHLIVLYVYLRKNVQGKNIYCETFTVIILNIEERAE
jgi:hypothetical protein